MCHTTFHSLLRSSSMPEPRRPPRRCLWTRLGAGTPRCLSALVVSRRRNATRRLPRLSGLTPFFAGFSAAWQPRRERRLPSALPQRAFGTDSSTPSPPVLLLLNFLLLVAPPAGLLVETARGRRRRCHCCVPPSRGTADQYNDPSAGSPTETLLRLLLPLDAGARRTSGRAGARPPDNSPQHPIGRSDGRCVQRAGTHSARDH